MKRISMLLVAVMVLSTVVASANPFSDVPFSHWAYDAVNKLSANGILQGYPDGRYKGNQTVTRYALAMVTAKMLANVEQMLESGIGTNLVTKADLQTLEKLTVEFADELALLGVKVTALEDDMQVVKEDVSMLKKDVEGIKDYMAKGGMEKVKLSGDMMVRHTNVSHKNDWATQTVAGNSNNSLTESQIRFKFTANIDENITAVARWRMFIDNTDVAYGNQSARGGAFGINGIGVTSASDNVIDTAYLKIKDMFRFGGDFLFGRNMVSQGHNLLVNNYIDAVRYSKRSGDIDITFQTMYDRHVGSYKDDAAVDYRNIWNLNLGTKYRDHDLYMGIYMQDEPNLANRRHPLYNRVLNPTPAFVLNNPVVANAGCQSGDSRWDVEFGSKGAIGNNVHWDYDLGFAYTNYEIDMVNNAANTLISPEMQGWMGHVAVKWDSKKEWAAKLGFTFADDESVGAISLNNDVRYSDGSETPYEDISRGNRYFVNGLTNMTDLKLQVEYRPRDSKHYFRLAGDMLDEMEDTVTNDLTRYSQANAVAADAAHCTNAGIPAGYNKTNTAYDRWNNFGVSDAKATVLTFEYRYQLAENTRIRVGYTNFDFDGKFQKNTGAGSLSAGRGLGINDYDYNQFWVEIFNKF
ncbi:MAG: S-layer homology domain-containing protein [Candidatus Riflebacteria bacterium]|nr:S-layer homology domain-containing protein [Candidatus Riflebacteria bacterium]